jgi:hypothetical protein
MSPIEVEIYYDTDKLDQSQPMPANWWMSLGSPLQEAMVKKLLTSEKYKETTKVYLIYSRSGGCIMQIPHIEQKQMVGTLLITVGKTPNLENKVHFTCAYGKLGTRTPIPEGAVKQTYYAQWKLEVLDEEQFDEVCTNALELEDYKI